MAAPDEEPFDKARHTRYWTRCIKTLLPSAYTSNDSTRMGLGFFIVSAIDLLSHPSSTDDDEAQKKLVTEADKKRIRGWVLSLQHPDGGFVGSPNHMYPSRYFLPEKGRHSSQANIAATYFALILLAAVAPKDYEENAYVGVDRIKTLQWLRMLQRSEGSFGEVVDENGIAKGGRDMRYCYLAAAVRWMLRGSVEEGGNGWVEDIDVDGLVGHIRRAQTYDGGISESSENESHAGYAYCAVAALSLLSRPNSEDSSSKPTDVILDGIPDIPALVKFLTYRQFAYVDPPEDEDEDEDNFHDVSIAEMEMEDLCVGYNGRCNKVADTCYCWWVGGALDILGQKNLISKPPSRRFLLTKTQHLIGGFAKHPSNPPDIYHSYLGLAALSVMGEPELKEFDAPLCTSKDTARKVEVARAALVGRYRNGT